MKSGRMGECSEGLYVSFQPECDVGANFLSMNLQHPILYTGHTIKLTSEWINEWSYYWYPQQNNFKNIIQE